MSSIIEGYNYDIFISYRQKDNKGDRWVSNFVDALKTELEATFKEDVSVYFDENPHDRLQETHNVDKSLEGKLKCLIFIPILSQTYCDPNSYAWQYEFLAFLQMVKNDRFGKDVKLRGGNVASRILPIRIHDLEPEDVKLFEKETGTVLRAMDFVFKTSSGVNRPLKSNEDHPQDNLNKTFYGDQINKVANAIKEIILGIKSTTGSDNISKGEQPFKEVQKELRREKSDTGIINNKSKKWLIVVISVIIVMVGAFAVYKLFESSKRSNDIAKVEKSIAVLPFVNDSPDQENTYFINGIMDEILNNLQKIEDFRVLSRTSVEKYRGENKLSIPEIAKELDVNYIVEGSGQKYGNKFRLRVQLITAKNEEHLWGESYEQEINTTIDIFKIQSQVAKAIAAELKGTITPEENNLIDKTFTTSLTAYDFYQRGSEELRRYRLNNSNKQALKNAEALFYKALEFDSLFAIGYTGLASVYLTKHYFESYYTKNFLDSVLILADLALSYDDHLPTGYYFRSLYYLNNGNPDEALNEIERAIKYNPNYWEAYRLKAIIHNEDMNNQDYVQALESFGKALKIGHGLERPSLLRDIGDAYCFDVGFPDKAEYYCQEAFKLDGDTVAYLSDMGGLEIQYGDFESGIEKALKAYAMDTNNITLMHNLGIQYFFHGLYKESFKYLIEYKERLESLGKFPKNRFLHIGYVYWQNGYKKEAEYWFNEQKKISLESIRLGRDYSTTYYFSSNAYYDLACIYSFMGEKEKAYEMLKIINRSSVFPFGLVADIKIYNPLFNNIRNEPEFQLIVREMETKYQAEHERVRKWLEEKRIQ